MSEGSLEKTFKTYAKEIHRRSNVAQQGQVSHSFQPVEDVNAGSFTRENQLFVVFSLSQEGLAPVPVNLHNPAICIFGAFATRAEATNYAQNKVAKYHPNLSILVDETHHWIVGAKNVKNLFDADYIEAHRSKLLEEHGEKLIKNNAEFKENVTEQKTGRADYSEAPPLADDDDNCENDKGEAHGIETILDVRGQKVAAVMIIKDDAKVPEFLIHVLGLFDGEEEANAYVRNVAAENVQDFDIDIVGTCEWIFPQTMTHDKVTKEMFRQEELDLIMKSHRNQPKEVQKFNDFLEEEAAIV